MQYTKLEHFSYICLHKVYYWLILYLASVMKLFFNLNFSCCPFSLPLFLYWGVTVLYKSVTSPLFVKMNLPAVLSNPFADFNALYKIRCYSSFGILMTNRLRKNFYLLEDKTDTGEQFRQLQGSQYLIWYYRLSPGRNGNKVWQGVGTLLRRKTMKRLWTVHSITFW